MPTRDLLPASEYLVERMEFTTEYLNIWINRVEETYGRYNSPTTIGAIFDERELEVLESRMRKFVKDIGDHAPMNRKPENAGHMMTWAGNLIPLSRKLDTRVNTFIQALQDARDEIADGFDNIGNDIEEFEGV